MGNGLTYELRMVFKSHLGIQLSQQLSAHFPAAADVGVALARTAISGIESYARHAKFAEDLHGWVSIFILEDANTLVLFSEKMRPLDPGSLSDEIKAVKKHAANRMDSMRRFSSGCSNKIDSIQVTVNMGVDQMLFATESTFFSRLKSKAKSNLPARFSIPVTSTMVGCIISLRMEDILKSAITGVLAAVISIFVEAYSEDRMKYEVVS